MPASLRSPALNGRLPGRPGGDRLAGLAGTGGRTRGLGGGHLVGDQTTNPGRYGTPLTSRDRFRSFFDVRLDSHRDNSRFRRAFHPYSPFTSVDNHLRLRLYDNR